MKTIAEMTRADRGAWYKDVVGYDPTSDDPSITDAALVETLTSYARAAIHESLDCAAANGYFGPDGPLSVMTPTEIAQDMNRCEAFAEKLAEADVVAHVETWLASRNAGRNP